MDVAAQKNVVNVSSSQLCNTRWKWVSPEDPSMTVTMSFVAENLKEKGTGKGIALTMTTVTDTGKDGKQKTKTFNYRLYKRVPNVFGKVQTVKEDDKLAATGPESSGNFLAYAEWGRINSSTYMTFSCDEICAFSEDSLTLHRTSGDGSESYATFIRMK